MEDLGHLAALGEVERLVEAGALDRAYDVCRDLISRDPRSADAYLALALICLRAGAPDGAIEFASTARSLAPGDARPDAACAEAWLASGEVGEALASAKRALSLGPIEPDTLVVLGRVFSAAGDLGSAQACFSAAAQHAPEDPVALAQLAAVLHLSGDFLQAEAKYRAALARDENLPTAWFALTQLRPHALSAEDLRALKDLAARTDDPANALLLAHAIAKTQEDAGDYAGALETLAAPKRARKASSGYTFEQDAPLFEAARATFSDAAPVSGGHTGEAAIFVVGLPRTGTTLVERILAAHADVQSLGETEVFWRAAKHVARTSTNRALDVETLHAAALADASRIGAEYIRRVAARKRGAARTVDKMPLNAFYAGVICRALPNARIVCVRRDPLDACIANYAQYFTGDTVYYGYVHDLEDAARYCRSFEFLADYWKTVLPPDQYTELRYERLIADQESETRRLLEFCGLPWDARCLDFHAAPGAVRSASAVQARQRLHSGSIGRWRRYGAAMAHARAIIEAAN